MNEQQVRATLQKILDPLDRTLAKYQLGWHFFLVVLLIGIPVLFWQSYQGASWVSMLASLGAWVSVLAGLLAFTFPPQQAAITKGTSLFKQRFPRGSPARQIALIILRQMAAQGGWAAQAVYTSIGGAYELAEALEKMQPSPAPAVKENPAPSAQPAPADKKGAPADRPAPYDYIPLEPGGPEAGSSEEGTNKKG